MKELSKNYNYFLICIFISFINFPLTLTDDLKIDIYPENIKREDLKKNH